MDFFYWIGDRVLVVVYDWEDPLYPPQMPFHWLIMRGVRNVRIGVLSAFRPGWNDSSIKCGSTWVVGGARLAASFSCIFFACSLFSCLVSLALTGCATLSTGE